MMLYLDTSAIVKRYIRESHSEAVIQRWQKATGIVTSAVAYAEAMAAFQRKQTESPGSDSVFRKVVHQFQSDWLSFMRVDVDETLHPLIDRVVSSHGLRGFDSIHLASALLIAEKIPRQITFVCFDKHLLQAAHAEGMSIYPLSTQP